MAAREIDVPNANIRRIPMPLIMTQKQQLFTVIVPDRIGGRASGVCQLTNDAIAQTGDENIRCILALVLWACCGGKSNHTALG